MIKLKNKEGQPFRLLARRAEDALVYAKRKAIRDALKLVAEKRYARIEKLYNLAHGYEVWAQPVVSIQRGLLTMGCHTFNRKDSQTIIDWANAK